MNNQTAKIESIEINNTEYKYHIESYGCQMNVSDSEIVASMLSKSGYVYSDKIEDADMIFLNTCSIREKAEITVKNRIKHLLQYKNKKKHLIIGVLGCMAERMKNQLLEEEKLVDIVAGPDSYRDLVGLIQQVKSGQKAVNVLLSREETYGDISPIRFSTNGVSAFVSIMRGCDNMCSFCVVPYTRGRERSRSADSILNEVEELVKNGFKEVTLLGQNVDSYKWSENPNLKGKNLEEKKNTSEVVNFANLLENVAKVSKSLRVRFSTSHPKDMTNDVLEVMAKYDNICKYIHLPMQSGSSSCLERMNRTYDREWYIDRIDNIKRIMPNCAISSDIIAGFCGETQSEFEETLSMMEYVKYDMNYMFFYSERPGTLAAKRFKDDIPLDTKKQRLTQIVELQNKHSLERNRSEIGQKQIILLEYTSKRSILQLQGRNDGNKKVIIDKENYNLGDYVEVLITDANSATLLGTPIRKVEF